MTAIWQELRSAAQSLARSRGFTVTVIAALAIAIALQTSIVAVINAYVLRALPYPAADRLYNVRYAQPPENPPRGLEDVDWRALDGVAEHGIAWDLDMFYLLGGEYPERVAGAWVTPGFVEGLGIRADLGRTLDARDFDAGQPQVALISHALWQSRFGGDSAVLGRTFRGYVSDRPADPETFTIVGVLPERFWHLNPFTQVLTPLRGESYPYMVRLRPGVQAADAERRIEQAVRDARLSVPDNWRVELRPLHADYVTAAKPMLVAAGSAVTVVVLIACANVALLMLLRGMRRRKEIAVRLALGAGMWRVARQLLAESLVLVGGATVAGIGAAALVLQAFAPAIEQQLGRRVPGGPAAMTIDWRVLAIALGSGLLVAVVLSLVPLMDARNAVASLRDRRAGGDRGGSRTRSTLIAVEVAGSVALLAVCGLLVRSVVTLLDVDLGVQTAGVVAAPLAVREQSYPQADQRAELYDRLLVSVAGKRGVRAAALSAPSPLESMMPLPVRAAEPADAAPVRAATRLVGGPYFETVGLSIVRGRAFLESDRLSADPVAVVSESAARALWGDQDPLGRRIVQVERRLPGSDTVLITRTVVGVARDVRQTPTDEEIADVYVPLAQSPARFAAVVLKGTAASDWLGPIREAVRQVDPEIAVSSVQQLDVAARQQLARPRFLVALFAAFGAFAATLGVLGLYAVVAYAVRQREHEIAVRIAVGADARSIVGLFFREGSVVVAAGLAAGVASAIQLGRVLRAQLYGVQPNDAATLAIVALTLGAAAAAAIWLPARRASRVDPIVALRGE
jgi:putative ABC transport system permease protein